MRLLVARRAGLPEHTPEEIEVFVDVSATRVLFAFEDGEEIELGRDELLAALTVPPDHARAA